VQQRAPSKDVAFVTRQSKALSENEGIPRDALAMSIGCRLVPDVRQPCGDEIQSVRRLREQAAERHARRLPREPQRVRRSLRRSSAASIAARILASSPPYVADSPSGPIDNGSAGGVRLRRVCCHCHAICVNMAENDVTSVSGLMLGDTILSRIRADAGPSAHGCSCPPIARIGTARWGAHAIALGENSPTLRYMA
jgi:hypothetical protein